MPEKDKPQFQLSPFIWTVTCGTQTPIDTDFLPLQIEKSYFLAQRAEYWVEYFNKEREEKKRSNSATLFLNYYFSTCWNTLKRKERNK